MTKEVSLPFYDSQWLTSYWHVHHYLERERPDIFPRFVAAMRRLEAPAGFRPILTNALFSADEFALVRDVFARLPEASLQRHELISFGRGVLHDQPDIVALQSRMTARVSQLVGEAVEPCYSFMSLYGNLGVCGLHMDAPTAKWTVDLCVDQSAPWPIQFSKAIAWPRPEVFATDDWRERVKADPDLEFTSVTLEPGQAVVFCGSCQWHYRDRIPRVNASNFCKLLFLHYRPRDSDPLVHQSEWSRHFGVPALDELVRIPVELDGSRVALTVYG